MADLNYKELFKKSLRDYFAPLTWIFGAVRSGFLRTVKGHTKRQ